MKTSANEIFAEYEESRRFKESVGDKGIYEQSAVNARFFSGDQWKGAVCGNERPLVRHNIIKRIGDFKMAQILSGNLKISYTADGVSRTLQSEKDTAALIKAAAAGKAAEFSGAVKEKEINYVLSGLSSYRNTCAARLEFELLCARALRDAYITGSGIVYTFWDSKASNGEGDIGCEVLSVNDVYFADPYEKDIQKQPYIIISSLCGVDAVCREAEAFGLKSECRAIREKASSGKVTVLTKLYKEYSADGSMAVKCVKVTENATVRKPFDTRLTMYPLAIFAFEENPETVYGDSEITYLIPNQIAINRMITANVWSSMSMGMPMMVVNGDTVSGDITNDPGQIIKIYGSNEDVKGAVSFVTPPDCAKDFNQNINNLIDNTLTQSGANAVVLGDVSPDNATAIITLRDTALLSLKLTKSRFNGFIRSIARIWADFYLNSYPKRNLRIEDENGIWYFPFDCERYKGISLDVKSAETENTEPSEKESFEILLTLYEKGIIGKNQFLKRIPKGMVKDVGELLSETDRNETEEE